MDLTITNLVIGWILAYTVFSIIAEYYLDIVPDSLTASGPLLLTHSERGLDLIERLSQPRRFWRAWGTLGVVVAVFGLISGFLMMVHSALKVGANPSQATIQHPRNMLVVPGLNDYLPLAAAPEIVAGLLLTLVVHEGGHAIMCRVEDIEISSTGVVFLSLFPVGAFVEPNEGSQEAAPLAGRMRMVSAGIMNNTALAVITLILLFGPLAAVISPAPGAAVSGTLPGSPAEQAGITSGDRITALNNTTVSSNAQFDQMLRNTSASTVTVTLSNGTSHTVNRSVLVTGAPASNEGLTAGATVTAVNGEPVQTANEYHAQLANQTRDNYTATLTLASGDTVTVPAGVLLTAQDGPLADAGVEVGTTATLVRLDGERIHQKQDLFTALQNQSANENVSATLVTENGTVETYTVTLGEDDDDTPLIGAVVYPGVSGITVSDFGIKYYPVETYSSLLTFTPGESLLKPLGILLVLPIASLLPGFTHNFSGFTPAIQDFYQVAVPDPFVGAWFFITSVVFWTAWININIALFNCLPTFALDGGYLIRYLTEGFFERLPGVDAETAPVTFISTSVKLATLGTILVIAFAPVLV